MKYYSELTQRLYDSEKECADAEEVLKRKQEEERLAREKAIAEKKARYEILQAAKINYETARKEYVRARDAYYGTNQPFTITGTANEAGANEKGVNEAKSHDTSESRKNDGEYNSEEIFSNILASILSSLDKEDN